MTALTLSRPRALVFSLALLTLGFAQLLSPTAAFAHHGRDFLTVETAELPHQGQIYLIARQDYIEEGEEDEIELEPAVIFGVTNRFALEVHSHVAREGEGSFEYESTSPAFHLRLSPVDAPWGVAVSAEYEFAHDSEAEDVAEARLILSRQLTGLHRSHFAFNLIAEEEQGEDGELEWGYAVGFRSRLTDRHDWGLEARGSFESEGATEALLGLFLQPTKRLTVQLGAGTAFGDEGPDFAFRSAVVWRLR